MEWLKKLLEGKGLTDEQIRSIIGGVEDNYKNFIPKHRFDEVNEAKKQLEADIKDRDKQLSELKKSVGDNEELKKQIEQLQGENKTKDEEYQSKIKDMTVSTAIKLALAGKAHDPDLIATLLDKSKIEVNEDGTIKSGLDDQVKALQESKAFLFVQKDQTSPRFKGATPADGNDKEGSGSKNPWSKEHFNLTEQGRLLRENPDLAKQMMDSI
ncbi:phage scaffolding protein [Paenibacillus larvae]|uniref:Phage minor structural protein GP20 n=1 Tax=Paenibacillus larvae subsp. larvae TaxID=147375 RepID=A0A6C0QVB9_9BACL|nr:phage scaffolding protein [Paenibacillus larvae]QHZ52166.1 Phage minor structural protein GP20 [Paenibacillus larvae subsp. larvae]